MAKSRKKQKANHSLQKIGMFVTIGLIFFIIFTALLGVKSFIEMEVNQTITDSDTIISDEVLLSQKIILHPNEQLSAQVNIYNDANTPAQNVRLELVNCSSDIIFTSNLIESITPRESELVNMSFITNVSDGEFDCVLYAKKDPYAQIMQSQDITLVVEN